MQQTIINLSQEVDLLSQKNIEFLADMRKKDPCYESYRKALDELEQLREAHGTLISMIKTNQIQVEESIGNQTFTEMSETDGGPRMGSMHKFGPNPYIEKVSQQDQIQMLDSLNQHKQGRNSHGPKLQQRSATSFLTCGVYGGDGDELKKSHMNQEADRPVRKPRINHRLSFLSG